MLMREDGLRARSAHAVADETECAYKADAHSDLPSGSGLILLVGSGVLGILAAAVALLLGKGLLTAVWLYFAVSLLVFGGALAVALCVRSCRQLPAVALDCDAGGAARTMFLRNRLIRTRIGLALVMILAVFMLTDSTAIQEGVVLLCCGGLLWSVQARRAPPHSDTSGIARRESGTQAGPAARTLDDAA
ncbi:hypothetical protein [Ruegeria aquimaris]|uniref:Uncharacterized protein n=1 Tax=Ruegeria aquimaris TaxID=2984333 RepID=A0ABT3AI43_9RHOB|nr:hypothetical protein [Ruegeria sp. XHP0148]MCV2888328.1 hypothetical protein [Ruegeria sp. XHP0148]